MGAIWFKQNRLIACLSEIIGYKSGLALNKSQIIKAVANENDFLSYLKNNERGIIRIRSEELESLIEFLLYQLGNIPQRKTTSISDLMIKYASDPQKSEIFQAILKSFIDLIKTGRPHQLLDTTKTMNKIFYEYGKLGVQLFLEIIEAHEQSTHACPWISYRSIDWKDIVELDDLFKSESMKVSHGKYIDQRLIDYLYKNFSEIDKIHWRKFEQLVAEYFYKHNWNVELSSGRNDDGVDIRISRKENLTEMPEIILIQCKRQKRKIEKIIVKALWADIINENANSGLIVTTSTLSPGAKKVCQARAYKVREADKKSLKKWLKKMKSPGNGVFSDE